MHSYIVIVNFILDIFEQMNIIFDTNIFQSNFNLSQSKFDVISSYLRKTKGELLVPYVVKREIEKNFKSSLKKRMKSIISSYNEANPFLLSMVTSPKLLEIESQKEIIESYLKCDIENDVSNYFSFVKEKIPQTKVYDVCPLDLDFTHVIEQALVSEPPFKQSGEGFKDALVWQSVLKCGLSSEGSRIIFITQNSNDFGKNEILNENLLKESKQKGVEIIYYNSIDSFISKYFKTIESISISDKDISITDLLKNVNIYFSDKKENEKVLKEFQKESFTYVIFNEVQAIKINQITDLVVKDINEDFYYIHGTIFCSSWIHFIEEIYSESVNSYTGDFDYDIDYDHVLIEADLTIHFNGEYKDDKLIQFFIQSATIKEKS